MMENVADLMTEDVITVTPDTDLSTAWNLFDDAAIRHLPVVDDDGNLVGVLSHRDLARRALASVDDLTLQEQHALLAERTVEEVMQRSPEYATPDEPLVDAAERMIENKFGCLPVVEGMQVVGIVTESDFVRLYLHMNDR
jgi:CBS domain-containing membrane protein